LKNPKLERLVDDRLRDRRVIEALKALPEVNYGEAALTILGVKPVSLLSTHNPAVRFLNSNPALMRELGLHVHTLVHDIEQADRSNVLLVNKPALPLVETSYVDDTSSIVILAHIFMERNLEHQHAGAFLGYPVEGMPPQGTGVGVSWMAVQFVEGEEKHYVTHYMGFLVPSLEGVLPYLDGITRACRFCEHTRRSRNLIKFCVDQRGSAEGTVTYF
jgi:hypothetical protein